MRMYLLRKARQTAREIWTEWISVNASEQELVALIS